MDIDTIKKIIQDFFQEGTVTIVGSEIGRASCRERVSERV